MAANVLNRRQEAIAPRLLKQELSFYAARRLLLRLLALVRFVEIVSGEVRILPGSRETVFFYIYMFSLFYGYSLPKEHHFFVFSSRDEHRIYPQVSLMMAHVDVEVHLRQTAIHVLIILIATLLQSFQNSLVLLNLFAYGWYPQVAALESTLQHQSLLLFFLK